MTGTLPTFHPTLSPDLDALLSTFRTNVFLPAHLLRAQQDLIYKRSNWPTLKGNDSATVELSDENIQLQPLDRTKDEPSTRKNFHQVVKLMDESGDWRNLQGWLEGLKSAGRKIEGGVLEKVVRKVVEAKKMGIIIECLQRVEYTGLGLWDLGVAREAMWGGTAIAVQGKWSEGAVEKGVRYAENVWAMMCDEKHAGVQLEDYHPRSRPEVLGLLVLVHAAQAVMFKEGKDEAGMVGKYARLLLQYWDRADLEKVEDGDWVDANIKIFTWAPVLHGLKMARMVVGEESALGKSLGGKVDRELEPLLQKTRLILEATPGAEKRRGLAICESLSRLSS